MKPSYKLSGAGVSLFVFGLLVVCLSAPPAWAQATTGGTIIGQVTDQQNAAVPDAEVTLLDVSASSAPRRTSTNAAGRYTFAKDRKSVV